MLSIAVEKTKSFGLDYDKMTEAEQYELGSYVNLMFASTKLLVNPILGLQPKYSEVDYEDYVRFSDKNPDELQSIKDLVIAFANLLYKIDLDAKDKKLLWKSFRKNQKFLLSVDTDQKDLDFSILDTVCDALKHKQESEEGSTGKV